MNTQCIHLNTIIHAKGKAYAKKNGLKFNEFVEKLIYRATSKVNCSICVNSYCMMTGTKKWKESCNAFKRKK